MFGITLIDNFQHHGQSVDTAKYPCEIKGKMYKLPIKRHYQDFIKILLSRGTSLVTLKQKLILIYYI